MRIRIIGSGRIGGNAGRPVELPESISAPEFNARRAKGGWHRVR